MTLKQIFALGIINNKTNVWLRGHKSAIIAFGHWYQEKILDHMNTVVRNFTWYDNNTVSIELDLEVSDESIEIQESAANLEN